MSYPYTPTWSGDITLNVVDSNGNVVGTVTITQDVADKLYDYYIVKIKNDLLTDPQWIAYLKIAMYAPFAWLVPPSTSTESTSTSTSSTATCPAVALGLGLPIGIMFNAIAMLLPLAFMRNLFSNPLEQIFTLVVLIPLLNALK